MSTLSNLARKFAACPVTKLARTRRKGGFTLLQLVVVIAIIALLAAISFGFLGRSRRAAQRAACDVHLKALSMALDAYRQERGAYPANLSQLQAAGYITDASVLRCPLDPRGSGGSYEDYYMYRAARPNSGDPRDPSTLPVVVCPFHEEDGNQGNQAFARQTQQFTTRPATIASISGATTVERPGKNPIAARVGMTLHGGDRIVTASGGAAKITFADGSSATLAANADVTVVQSFLDGQQSASLYTLLRQRLGQVSYQVHHGSKFDVATPTATAGALGTEFTINCQNGNWYLKVSQSKVLVASPSTNKIYYAPAVVGTTPHWNFIGTETARPTPPASDG